MTFLLFSISHYLLGTSYAMVSVAPTTFALCFPELKTKLVNYSSMTPFGLGVDKVASCDSVIFDAITIKPMPKKIAITR